MLLTPFFTIPLFPSSHTSWCSLASEPLHDPLGTSKKICSPLGTPLGTRLQPIDPHNPATNANFNPTEPPLSSSSTAFLYFHCTPSPTQFRRLLLLVVGQIQQAPYCTEVSNFFKLQSTVTAYWRTENRLPSTHGERTIYIQSFDLETSRVETNSESWAWRIGKYETSRISKLDCGRSGLRYEPSAFITATDFMTISCSKEVLSRCIKHRFVSFITSWRCNKFWWLWSVG
jgi:hypothetical protein